MTFTIKITKDDILKKIAEDFQKEGHNVSVENLKVYAFIDPKSFTECNIHSNGHSLDYLEVRYSND